MSSLLKQLTFRPIIAAILGVLLAPHLTASQDLQSYKAGVVRIHNTKLEEAGTGFIIWIDKERAYIVTAAHVVKNNQHPNVYFFNRPNDPIEADLINREDDDQKGLALLLVKANKDVREGLISLTLGDPVVKGGEAVNVIGFPDGTTFWSITPAHISRVEGRNLVFSGPISGGNSGGPVLINGVVIGLVTDTTQGSGYAVRSENIPIYVKGIDPRLLNIRTERKTIPAKTDGAPTSELCKVLNEWLSASREGFHAILGDQSGTNNTFHPKIMISGASGGYVVPNERVYNYLLIDQDKSKIERQFYAVVSEVKACLPRWKEKEDDSSSDRFHKFRENKDSIIVVVYYSREPQYGKYYLTLSVDLLGPNTLSW